MPREPSSIQHRPSKEILGSGRYQNKRGETSSHSRPGAVRRDIKLSVRHRGSFKQYLTNVWSVWWFYVVIIIAVWEFFFVIYDVKTGPLLFFRIAFGLGVLGIIPGFLTVMAVFPGSGVNTLEKIALGIFLSVLISIAVGVVLGVGQFFQASNNIILLTVYVIIVDVAAGYRSYRFVKRSR